MLAEDGRAGPVDEMSCKNVSWRCQQRLYAGEAASKSTVKSYGKDGRDRMEAILQIGFLAYSSHIR